MGLDETMKDYWLKVETSMEVTEISRMNVWDSVGDDDWRRFLQHDVRHSWTGLTDRERWIAYKSACQLAQTNQMLRRAIALLKPEVLIIHKSEFKK